MSELEGLDPIRVRREKLNQLQEMKIEAFGYQFDVSHTTRELETGQAELIQAEQTVRIAGRMMSLREMGKTKFAHLQDAAGRIQIYLRKDTLGEEAFGLFKYYDIGDIFGVSGKLFVTHAGELTVAVDKLVLLSKSLLPLPEKWHGLKDVEMRFRQRYVDLIVNPDVKRVFEVRSRMISSIREFLNRNRFLEVETPILQPIYGGANARPFKTHHNALDIDLYLRIANELYLKRLIVGGMERVYEFAKDFRNEGMDKFHNPEFTLLEFYYAYVDYLFLMDFVEQMVVHAARQSIGTLVVDHPKGQIDLTPPWQRLTMEDAIAQYAGIQLEEHDRDRLYQLCKTRGIDVEPNANRGQLIDALFGELVEPHLIQPTFIYDYPLEMSPLAKMHRHKPGMTERFELFVGAKELANAFSELNDPIDQKERFLKQMELRRLGDDEAQVMDEDFVRALEYGMPPTGGVGIGIDRLAMLLTQTESIREVILFPQMRPEN
ncbi:MAG: lysine--tRNA ligase [Candidatus Delongbacteria bacterium]|nr:lysine--tRNA ligase [Candidatus Delongbacteria bacterium]